MTDQSPWMKQLDARWAKTYRERTKWFMRMAREAHKDDRHIFVREARHHHRLAMEMKRSSGNG